MARPFGHAGPFGYQESSATGLQLLGHRYYDPSTGRFLTRDPAKDGRIRYSYGAGKSSPVTIEDSTGLVRGWLLKFLAGERRIKYIIFPSEAAKKSYIKKKGGLLRGGERHNNGALHDHSVDRPDEHLTTVKDANEATGYPWDNWRNHAEPMDLPAFWPIGLLQLLNPTDVIGA